MISKIAAAAIAVTAASGAVAADMLPLKQGIYVPVGRPCRGASNAEMMNYWGGNSSLGAAQAECKIRKVVKKGTVYTIFDRCTDIQSGGVIAGAPTVVAIPNATAFKLNGTAYRYCGPKVQF